MKLLMYKNTYFVHSKNIGDSFLFFLGHKHYSQENGEFVQCIIVYIFYVHHRISRYCTYIAMHISLILFACNKNNKNAVRFA